MMTLIRRRKNDGCSQVILHCLFKLQPGKRESEVIGWRIKCCKRPKDYGINKNVLHFSDTIYSVSYWLRPASLFQYSFLFSGFSFKNIFWFI
jgi:hypothetical protein